MPNINDPSTGWKNIYNLLGLAPGTALNIQNQSAQTLYLRQNTTDNPGRAVLSFGNQDCFDAAVLEGRCDGGLRLFVQEL